MGRNKYIIPLAFIGMMFFTVGFATGINGYFVPFLESNLHLSSAQSYLVIAATFVAFLVFSFPASTIIGKIGYKHTMSLSFFLFALAFFLFIPAARLESFAMYLLACFLSGSHHHGRSGEFLDQKDLAALRPEVPEEYHQRIAAGLIYLCQCLPHVYFIFHGGLTLVDLTIGLCILCNYCLSPADGETHGETVSAHRNDSQIYLRHILHS